MPREMSDFYEACTEALHRAYRYGTTGDPDKRTGDFRNKLKLIALREMVSWEVGENLNGFFRQLFALIDDWTDQLPNLRDIFLPKEIEYILLASMKHMRRRFGYDQRLRLVKFVADSGYRYEPNLDEIGRPVKFHTTPIHRVDRLLTSAENTQAMIRELLRIYQLNVNYTSEVDDLSHFHVVCEWGLEDAVEKFLDIGCHPNFISGRVRPRYLPLIFAVSRGQLGVAALLLRRGAHPTLATANGWTALHEICGLGSRNRHRTAIELAKMLFEISEEKRLRVNIDARDVRGRTPLSLAVSQKNWMLVELLLKRGADTSLPLHAICKIPSNDDAGKLLRKFFIRCLKVNREVEIDARNEHGETPLQLAVANLMSQAVDVLLDRGADLTKFVFPTEHDFFHNFRPDESENEMGSNVILAARAMVVLDSLESKGFELELSEALAIMKLFARHKMFEAARQVDDDNSPYDSEEFRSQARQLMMGEESTVSLHDAMHSPPQESARLIAPLDYDAHPYDLWWGRSKWRKDDCFRHLCERLSRRFFRDWALECFMVLIHYRLPLECCESIVDGLMNEDLYHICLAAAGLKDSKKDVL